MRRVFFNWAVLVAAALVPMTALGGNQEKAESIASVLEAQSLTEGCDIGLKFQDETVWLTGVVDDAAKLNAIQKAIESVDGVAKVVNDLTVEKQVINDKEVQQVAGYQYNSALADIPAENIISDEVISPAEPSVLPMQVMSTPETVTTAPASVIAAGQGTPMPLKKVSYGTTVTGDMAPTPAPAQYAAPANAPLPMNPAGYNMQYRTSAAMQYDAPYVPQKAWPSYAAYENVAAVQYPTRYCPGAFPYIGPIYPYPQVPDGWRKVTLEWHDGYWHLDFDDGTTKGPCSGLFRMKP